MRIDVITLFPELFTAITDAGVTGRAHAQALWSLHAVNPRDFSQDIHRTVDDRPYGGGPGMVMMAEPLGKAVESIKDARGDAPVVLLSPIGKQFNQTLAEETSRSAGVVFVCGRYEGIDQRFIDKYVDEQWSLGDFVLSGGEIAAMAMIDATVRLLPGVLNHSDSALQDSFQTSISGLLDSPHFTRPDVFDNIKVPDVLLSGNHARIARWRREQSLLLTEKNRPDLIRAARARGDLSREDEVFLGTLV